MSNRGATAGHLEQDTAPGVVTRLSPLRFAETVDRCLAVIGARGLKLFAVIDHGGEAQAASLELRDTKVILFGSPEAGTPIMAAAPLAALDLPLRLLIWADGDTTKVSYTSPATLAARYGLSPVLGSRLDAIHNIASAVVADQRQAS